MNKINLAFALLFGLLILSSCSKDEMNNKSEYDKSYKAWLSFKEKSSNNYRYEVRTSSWTGYSSVTTITVTNGKVTQRSYSNSWKVSNGTEVVDQKDFQKTEWTESESEINTHAPFEGASPLTLDEVYEKARIEWLIKRDGASYFFETKNNGLISLCGYVDDNCADDCFNGINISHIESL